MEDRFVKDIDKQLIVDYENEIRNEINSIFDDIKKNEPLYAEVSRKEAKFWMEIIFKILNKKVDSLKSQKNAPIEEENEEQGK